MANDTLRLSVFVLPYGKLDGTERAKERAIPSPRIADAQQLTFVQDWNPFNAAFFTQKYTLRGKRTQSVYDKGWGGC